MVELLARHGWAVALRGFLALAFGAGIRLRRHRRTEWLFVLMGVLSLRFGILILRFPSIGALVVVLWIGSYALIFRFSLTALAFCLRPLARVE